MEFPPSDVKLILEKIASILRERNFTLAVSEAACGGLLSSYIVSIPGASDFYIGGKLVYSLKQRLKLSGWNEEEIRNYMGPSEQVALKLARTAKYELGSTFVLSETGFAGPTSDLHLGNDETKANDGKVGTVYLGLFGPNLQVSCKKQTGSTVRSHNMVEFAKSGLVFLLEELEKLP
ncbi:hypothetical protein CLIB1444_08S05534 [[Candida] jaroonii]|uniref:Uncharacterized protein n=1 Tax=[Candida] jaroonii TaxID=467808 RepID=A0ACA9YC48_9ASCO|nr:hypothetical protein CLIB1444_08S05534 [[Candida] jaroonii]